MRRFIGWLVAVWALSASVAQAESPVVVELFTSQGCSSCPPADALLGDLANRDDVIALGLHVDYWDYIGWKDHFADPSYSARQRAYARAAQQHSVYTPEIVVGGKDHLVGSKGMRLAELIQRHKALPSLVDVELSRNSAEIDISVDAQRAAGEAEVLLAVFQPHAAIDIHRGENAGRRLEYHNIVRELVRLGTWDGRTPFRTRARVPDGFHVAVLVQRPNAGPIIGAAQLR